MDFFQSQSSSLWKSYARDLIFTTSIHFKRIPAVLAFCCLFISPITYATIKSILIITDNRTKTHNKINSLLLSEWENDKNLSIRSKYYKDINLQQINNTPTDLIITLGTLSSKQTLPTDIPIIHSLIPENSLKDTSFHTNNSYAIYLDHPLNRQLNFLTLLLPSANKVGVLTADFSSNKLTAIQEEIQKLNLSLYSRYINKGNNINRELNSLIEEIDVLFAVPDPLIHNRENIPFLLLSTYRYSIPLIGFSKSYVNAGAVAAIYSTPSQIMQQIKELSQQLLYSPLLISKHYFAPKYFSIAINKSVINSLDIHIPDIETIKTKLLLLEK